MTHGRPWLVACTWPSCLAYCPPPVNLPDSHHQTRPDRRLWGFPLPSCLMIRGLMATWIIKKTRRFWGGKLLNAPCVFYMFHLPYPSYDVFLELAHLWNNFNSSLYVPDSIHTAFTCIGTCFITCSYSVFTCISTIVLLTWNVKSFWGVPQSQSQSGTGLAIISRQNLPYKCESDLHRPHQIVRSHHSTTQIPMKSTPWVVKSPFSVGACH